MIKQPRCRPGLAIFVGAPPGMKQHQGKKLRLTKMDERDKPRENHSGSWYYEPPYLVDTGFDKPLVCESVFDSCLFPITGRETEDELREIVHREGKPWRDFYKRS